MRTIIVLVATTAALAAPAASRASTSSTSISSCSASHFRSYARAVYRRKRVTAKALHRITRSRQCLGSWASRYQRRLSRERYNREHAWSVSMASWYSKGDSGGRPACGLGWDQTARMPYGVANKTLACGSHVRMCSSRCVTATVADRGPYVGGRDFDLMPGLRDALGCGGVCSVRWRSGDR